MSEKSLSSRLQARKAYNFFYQTFKRRSGDEYAELLTRGVRTSAQKSEGDEINTVHPWAYIRLFALFFILYAVFLLIIRFTGNQIFAPAVALTAAVAFNVPVLCFLFELYPQRNLPFIGVLLAALIGGASACVIAASLYNLFPAKNQWLGAVYAGFFEELSKAVVTVLTIVISRKRSPLAGFLFGAAVGCGFSVVEDMGYIIAEANQLPAFNLVTIVEISLSRGVTALCTHTLWTGIVGWSYSYFNRHLYNVACYACLLLSCGLHICWDLPLPDWAKLLVNCGCAAVILLISGVIIYRRRKAVFDGARALPQIESGGVADEQLVISDVSEGDIGEIIDDLPQKEQADFGEQERVQAKRDYLYWKHWGHFSLVLSAFLMAIVSIIYCAIPFAETYETKNFSDPQEFTRFMQNGADFDIHIDRAYNYNASANDIEKIEVDGVLTSVTQPVDKKDATYKYRYTAAYDGISNRYYFFLADISVTVRSADGAYITYVKEDLYNDGKLYASFFRLNGNVTGFNFESDGSVTAFVYNADFVRDLSEPRYVALFYTFGGLFGIAVLCYCGLVIKSWRVKKLCSKQTASSAK